MGYIITIEYTTQLYTVIVRSIVVTGPQTTALFGRYGYGPALLMRGGRG